MRDERTNIYTSTPQDEGWAPIFKAFNSRSIFCIISTFSGNDTNREDSTAKGSEEVAQWPRSVKEFQAFVDRFSTLRGVSREIRKECIESCGLIFAIDYTTSNMTQGAATFGGHSLHDTMLKENNPYQKVIAILGETLEQFDDDGIIPAYGFGDRKTTGRSVFSLKDGGHCRGFAEVLQVYQAITPDIQLAGPTKSLRL